MEKRKWQLRAILALVMALVLTVGILAVTVSAATVPESNTGKSVTYDEPWYTLKYIEGKDGASPKIEILINTDYTLYDEIGWADLINVYDRVLEIAYKIAMEGLLGDLSSSLAAEPYYVLIADDGEGNVLPASAKNLLESFLKGQFDISNLDELTDDQKSDIKDKVIALSEGKLDNVLQMGIDKYIVKLTFGKSNYLIFDVALLIIGKFVKVRDIELTLEE